jgi:hypothetical protein
MALANLWFFNMPLTFKSSMPIVWKQLVKRVVNLCKQSNLRFFILKCNLAILTLALLRFCEPFCLRDKLFENFLNFINNDLCDLIPVIDSPVDKVAKFETPKSTPTTPWFLAFGT